MEVLQPQPIHLQIVSNLPHLRPPPLPPSRSPSPEPEPDHSPSEAPELPPVVTCQHFLPNKNRTCLRRITSSDQYCYQHQNSPRIEILQNEESEDESIEECPICLVEMEQNVCQLDPCHHKFHAQCFCQLYTMECPLCRRIPTNIPRSMMPRLNQYWVQRH